jgi:hypothetical protein
MNKYSRVIIMALVVLSLNGCAKWRNEIAANGGIIGSYKGTYIVRNDSGGKIMDMWILKNVIVQSEFSGAGWLFQDEDGDVIHLSGDVKVMRVENLSILSQYNEYHAEFENKSYQELYPYNKAN